jgi:uncharacterized membrane protein YsdA (DUF1294 family)
VWIWIILWYALASAAAALMYGWDKRQARRGRWRIPESRLLLAEMAGGWPGAMLARHMLRHKTRHRRLIAISWMMAILHLGVWLAIALLP